MILYMYIAPRQGLTTPWGCNFYVNWNILSLWSYDFIHVYSLGQGQTAPRGQCFGVNINVLSLHSFVASLKKMSLKSDFIYFFFMI